MVEWLNGGVICVHNDEDCRLRALDKLEPDARTDGQADKHRSAFIELLSEPKIK